MAVMSDESAGLGRGKCNVSDAAGFFFLSKTNNGHVTGRCALLAGLRTSQIEQTAKPEKGGGRTLELEELEQQLDFPSPHARAE